MIHSDLKKRRIQTIVSKSLPNLQSGRKEIRLKIKKYSIFITIYWIFLAGGVAFGFINYSNVYNNEYLIFNYWPMRIVFKNVSNVEKFVFRMMVFISSVTLSYSTIFPVTLGIYVTFHVWAQFCLLNDYLKINLWKKSKDDELWQDQQQISKILRKIIKWHLQIKR